MTTRPLFSIDNFTERAKNKSISLDQALWMTDQPTHYGIDAGQWVNNQGQPQPGSRLDLIYAEHEWRYAAVLVPVIAHENAVSLLLTQRKEHLRAHAGQISFPGGVIETQDKTPVEAALREAKEEIGLELEQVKPLGLLDLHKTGTGYRIIPVLALVDSTFQAKACDEEVSDIFEVPLSFLMSEQNHRIHYREWLQKRVAFHAMTYKNRFIWGATAAIIRNLYDRLYSS